LDYEGMRKNICTGETAAITVAGQSVGTGELSSTRNGFTRARSLMASVRSTNHLGVVGQPVKKVVLTLSVRMKQRVSYRTQSVCLLSISVDFDTMRIFFDDDSKKYRKVTRYETGRQVKT
uniref:Vacuolar protein sorting-associated protein 13D n=1 Tax=Schistocephalus solidus TaxID=70667 RepID=A0A183TPT0_SCHSO